MERDQRVLAFRCGKVIPLHVPAIEGGNSDSFGVRIKFMEEM